MLRCMYVYIGLDPYLCAEITKSVNVTILSIHNRNTNIMLQYSYLYFDSVHRRQWRASFYFTIE